MTPPAPAADLEVRANDLYWGSDYSVNQIAEELDLSKGTLYGLLEPLPSGMACPGCGAEVHYPNRTAHERGNVTCPACDYEGHDVELDALESAASEGAPRREGVSRAVARVVTSRKTLWGAALLGVAVGLVIAGLNRRE